MTTETPRRFTPGMLLPELVSTRGVAAVWVVLAHSYATVLKGHYALPAAIEYSRVIVDFFFVLSGFVLAHMYDGPWREGRFRHGEFLIRRLARLWPLHLFTLACVLALVVAGRIVGVTPEATHDAASFAMTALMLHSAWTTPDLAWNWPSWSVSAEWIAYLMIPLYLAAADRVRGTARRLALSLALFAVCSVGSHVLLRLDLVTLTFDGGALRLLPSFLAGILLRRIFDDEPKLLAMTPRIYALVIVGVFAACGVLIALNAPYDALWPPMLVLVAALASRATWAEPGVLRNRTLIWLGDLSYSIYLTHAIVIMVLFTGAEHFGFARTLGERAVVGVCVPFVTLGVSVVTYAIVEKPGRAGFMWVVERLARAQAARRARASGMRI
ncbi:acyltransferase family protein [Methylopila henanensis]|uniref:Acyltransferase family protein n=1 Tax=Methylopila henanensis TaxID=873516 RepID=A0ABW4K1Z5_9HYPH